MTVARTPTRGAPTQHLIVVAAHSPSKTGVNALMWPPWYGRVVNFFTRSEEPRVARHLEEWPGATACLWPWFETRPLPSLPRLRGREGGGAPHHEDLFVVTYLANVNTS
jgi:hypothetical protein